MSTSAPYPRVGTDMLYEQIAARYPSLLRAMRWAALLSQTEAEDCIRALQERRLQVKQSITLEGR